MITFDFDHDAELSDAVPIAFGMADGSVPVRLNIGGVELLGSPDVVSDNEASIWTPLNLFEVATYGLWCLRQVQKHKRTFFSLEESPGELLFVLEGDNLLVHSTLRERSICVKYAVLEAAWQQFAQRIKTILIQHFPHLESHPDWLIPEKGLQRVSPTYWERMWPAAVYGHEHCLTAIATGEKEI